jgi:hypothetical protein
MNDRPKTLSRISGAWIIEIKSYMLSEMLGNTCVLDFRGFSSFLDFRIFH